jgi:hypothetical protein
MTILSAVVFFAADKQEPTILVFYATAILLF